MQTTKPTGKRAKPKTYTPQERHEKRARQAARAPQTPANVYRQRPYVAPEPPTPEPEPVS